MPDDSLTEEQLQAALAEQIARLSASCAELLRQVEAIANALKRPANLTPTGRDTPAASYAADFNRACSAASGLLPQQAPEGRA